MGKYEDSQFSGGDSHSDHSSQKRGKKKNRESKPEKQKKQKAIEKATKPKQNRQKKEEKNQSKLEKKSNIYQQEQSFSMEDIENYPHRPNYEVHSNPQSEKLNQPHQSMNLEQSQSNQSNSGQDSSMERQSLDEIEDLRMMLVEFFNSIDQPNGLVFKKDFRIKLKKLLPTIQFDDQHDLDPDGEELTKIKPQIDQLIIFDRKYHRTDKTEDQFRDYIKDDVKKMTQIFKEASFIFCREVTFELYNILRKLCNIALEFRNRDDLHGKNSIMRKNLREFGSKIASQKDKNHQYIFFGYQFIKFPSGKSKQELEELEGKDRFKYALKSKFREPGAEFSNFTEKAGRHLLEHLIKLDCFKTLR